MKLLNVLSPGSIFENGVLNKNEFCSTQFNSQKCIKFYQSTYSNKDGFYLCPNGLTCCKQGNRIYSSLLIIDHYSHSKIKRIKGPTQKVFTLDEITEIITHEENQYKLNDQLLFLDSNIKDLLHDITKTVGMISTDCSKIQQRQILDESGDFRIESVSKLSRLISNRISLFMLIQNPETINVGSTRYSDIYKMWDSFRNIFIPLANTRNIKLEIQKIDISGNVLDIKLNSINASIQMFSSAELIPFILIDNALKYSNDDSIVKIQFLDQADELFVFVVSEFENNGLEIDKVFERGYRGSQRSKSSGSGLGLSIARKTAEINSIAIECSVKNVTPNSYFIVKLVYKK